MLTKIAIFWDSKLEGVKTLEVRQILLIQRQFSHIYSWRSMSHVLALLTCTPGKYELKYELTTLIYPFEKQRTSSPVEGSREIAQLLVPTDPGGADRGWDGALSLHEWVWPSWYYTHSPITHTYVNTASTQRPTWINSSFMRALVCWRRDQKVIRWESNKGPHLTWTRGLVHTAHEFSGGGVCLWGAFMGVQWCLSVKGPTREGFESVLFQFVCLDITFLNVDNKELKC